MILDTTAELPFKVYYIVHKLSCGKSIPVYAGRTAVDLAQRFIRHFVGDNSKGKLAYFLANRENLSIELVASYATKKKWYEAEIAAIAHLQEQAHRNGWPNFNVGKGGEFDTLGLRFPKRSEQVRTKISNGMAMSWRRPGVAKRRTDGITRAMNKPEVKKAQRASVDRFWSKQESKEKQFLGLKERFGDFYPGTGFERIRGITVDFGAYRINVMVDGKYVSKSGFKTPSEAISALHALQRKHNKPLSVIPVSYLHLAS